MASITLTIEVDKMTPAEAQHIAGFLLSFAEKDQQECSDDPAKVFGESQIASFGPSVIIPDTTGVTTVGEITRPTAAIPAASPAPPAPPAPANGMIVDKDGLPWDGRIHASSKATNSDGTWRLKRGTEKAIVDAVTAELRKVMAIPAPVPGPQLVPNPPAPPAPANDELRGQYIALVGRASAAKGAGKISQDEINNCLQAIGVDTMPSLGIRLDLVPTAAQLIDGIIAGKNA